MFKKIYVLTVSLLEITLKCNMKCIHCGSSAGYQRKNELTTDEWIDVCKQLADLGCKRIALLGGEPFLRKDWYKISQKIRDLNIKLIIVSNGQSITIDIINKLQKLEPYTINISIDGATPKTHDYIRGVKGSFIKCKKALENLREANIPTTVITTVHKNNIKELPAMRDFLLNTGTAWQLQPSAPIGRFPRDRVLSKEEFYAAAMFIATTRTNYSFKEMPIIGADPFGYHSTKLPNIGLTPWRGCEAGISHMDIQSNGGIKGCLALPDKFVEGNTKETSLSQIWNNPDSFAYNRKFKESDLKNDCVGCKYGKTCKGGCLTFSDSITGESHCDPYCLRAIEKTLFSN
jgi:radical SAM protein with 4Fe4S-binding SPASM domain